VNREPYKPWPIEWLRQRPRLLEWMVLIIILDAIGRWVGLWH
jgi:hypothetical protein